MNEKCVWGGAQPQYGVLCMLAKQQTCSAHVQGEGLLHDNSGVITTP